MSQHEVDKHEDEKIDYLPPPRQQISMAPTFGSHQDPDVAPIIGWRTWLAIASVTVASFQQLFSLVVTAVSVRTAAAEIGGLDISVWNNQAFTILSGCIGPPIALGTDYLGRRNIMVYGYLVIVAGCFLSSEATSMGMMIAGSVLSAFSSAIIGLTSAIPSEILPHAKRATAQAILICGQALGGITGALLAGYLTNIGTTQWRWSFRIEGILSAIVFIVLFVCYRPPPRPVDPTLTIRDKLAKIDIVSSLLLSCFFIPFIAALTQGGNTAPWSSASVLAPLIFGLVCLVLLGIYSYFRKNGLLHHDLFSRSRNFAIALLCEGGEGAVFLTFNTFFPAFCATSYGESGVVLGARAATPFLGGAVSSVFVAVIVSKMKSVRAPVVIGFLLYTVACVGLACLPFADNAAAAWWFAMLIGLAVGPLIVNLVVIAQLAAPAHLIGLSSALLYTSRGVFGGVFIAIGTAVVNSKLPIELPSAIVPAVIGLGVNPTSAAFGQGIGPVIASAANFDAAGLGQALVAIGVAPQSLPQAIPAVFGAVSHAFGASYRWIFVMLAPVAFVVAIASLALADMSDQLNQIVDAPAEEIHHGKDAGIGI